MTLYVEILTPEGARFKGKAKEVQAPGVNGLFQVLPRHAPFIARLVQGRVRVTPADGSDPQFFTIEEGVLRVYRNHVVVLA